MMTSLEADFDLTDEGDVDAFLGVKIVNHEDGRITFSQPGLIQQILDDVNLENISKTHHTPALTKILNKAEDDEPFEASWSYRSIIGKLSYLSRNNRPDL